eukprot:Selendium_serpulae@DN5306_c0_g1_i1.p1
MGPTVEVCTFAKGDLKAFCQPMSVGMRSGLSPDGEDPAMLLLHSTSEPQDDYRCATPETRTDSEPPMISPASVSLKTDEPKADVALITDGSHADGIDKKDELVALSASMPVEKQHQLAGEVPGPVGGESFTLEGQDALNMGSSDAGDGTGDDDAAQLAPKMREQFVKTKLCPHHARGHCIHGTECTYAHAHEELRPLPDLQKTKLCESVTRSYPCRNPGCTYAHSREELRATRDLVAYKTSLCFFHKKGRCLNGEKCRFAHGDTELRSKSEVEEEDALCIRNSGDNSSRSGVRHEGSLEMTPRHVNSPSHHIKVQQPYTPSPGGFHSHSNHNSPRYRHYNHVQTPGLPLGPHRQSACVEDHLKASDSKVRGDNNISMSGNVANLYGIEGGRPSQKPNPNMQRNCVSKKEMYPSEDWSRKGRGDPHNRRHVSDDDVLGVGDLSGTTTASSSFNTSPRDHPESPRAENELDFSTNGVVGTREFIAHPLDSARSVNGAHQSYAPRDNSMHNSRGSPLPRDGGSQTPSRHRRHKGKASRNYNPNSQTDRDRRIVAHSVLRSAGKLEAKGKGWQPFESQQFVERSSGYSGEPEPFPRQPANLRRVAIQTSQRQQPSCGMPQNSSKNAFMYNKTHRSPFTFGRGSNQEGREWNANAPKGQMQEYHLSNGQEMSPRGEWSGVLGQESQQRRAATQPGDLANPSISKSPDRVPVQPVVAHDTSDDCHQGTAPWTNSRVDMNTIQRQRPVILRKLASVQNLDHIETTSYVYED